MQLTIPIQFDEDKLREIVAEAVERLKAEGYIWKDSPLVLPDTPTTGGINGKHILGRQDGSSPTEAD
jgi:hypothetical protein